MHNRMHIRLSIDSKAKANSIINRVKNENNKATNRLFSCVVWYTNRNTKLIITIDTTASLPILIATLLPIILHS